MVTAERLDAESSTRSLRVFVPAERLDAESSTQSPGVFVQAERLDAESSILSPEVLVPAEGLDAESSILSPEVFVPAEGLDAESSTCFRLRRECGEKVSARCGIRTLNLSIPSQVYSPLGHSVSTDYTAWGNTIE